MSEKVPTLAIYWGDTREILSNEERQSVFHYARIESLGFNEVLLRDERSHRLIVITDLNVKGVKCSLCKVETPEEHFGGQCLRIGVCYKDGSDSSKKSRKS